MSSRLIAQMKADSSRAIAVTITVRRLPFRWRDRKRPHNLVSIPRIACRAATVDILLIIQRVATEQQRRSTRNPRPRY